MTIVDVFCPVCGDKVQVFAVPSTVTVDPKMGRDEGAIRVTFEMGWAEHTCWPEKGDS